MNENVFSYFDSDSAAESLLHFVMHGSLVNMKPDSNFRAGQSRQTDRREVQSCIKKIFSSLSKQVLLKLVIDADNNVFSFDSEGC